MTEATQIFSTEEELPNIVVTDSEQLSERTKAQLDWNEVGIMKDNAKLSDLSIVCAILVDFLYTIDENFQSADVDKLLQQQCRKQ